MEGLRCISSLSLDEIRSFRLLLKLLRPLFDSHLVCLELVVSLGVLGLHLHAEVVGMSPFSDARLVLGGWFHACYFSLIY
jgi:hypothetical protein